MTTFQYVFLVLLIGSCAEWVISNIKNSERQVIMKVQELVDGINAVDTSVKAVAAAIAAEGDNVPEAVASAFTQLQTDTAALAALATQQIASDPTPAPTPTTGA